MKVVFQLTDKKCHTIRVIADVGRSTQKRIGKDWRLFLFGVEPQTCQCWEWLVYCRKLFQQGILKLLVIDFTHSIVMPERGNDVGHIIFGLHVREKYDNR